ncbi:hypothetical protein [Rhizobium etli]|uniref:hypothetical protein n=1 Tax=Rhizobium etli TaxID=29449 RepID=UPI003B847F2D
MAMIYRWQASVRKLDNIACLAVILDRSLFGLIEETIDVLFAAGQHWLPIAPSVLQWSVRRCESSDS